MAFHAVQLAADDADGTQAHVRGDFVRTVIAGKLGGRHSPDETFHIGLTDGHGDTPFLVPVLEGGHAADNRVEGAAGVENEEKVRQKGEQTAFPLTVADQNPGDHRGEAADVHLFQHPVGGELGVAPLEVAHDKPLGGIVHLFGLRQFF